MNDELENLHKPDLLRLISSERQALETALVSISPEEMLLPGAVGTWSVRDALAHIATWESWMHAWIGSHLRGETPQTPEPWDIDSMNAGAHERNRDLPLAAVLEEFKHTYQVSLALVESLTDEQLQTRYETTWPMGPLWLGVAANMNFHYHEHCQDILAWLAARK